MNKKIYIITTAVPGAKLNHSFQQSIDHFCKVNKAEQLILVSQKVYKKDQLSSLIPESKLVLTDKRLNSKIRLSTIPINPQATDPVTGLTRQAQTDGSFIFASPKQRLEIVPNSNTKLPHALMTTGAITKPYYHTTRNGVIAAQDHITGALIVEIANDNEYHFRHVEADTKGRFIDLCTRYSRNKTEKIQAEALVPGDIHAGYTENRVKQVIYELLELGKPKYLLLHDLADFISVNPHIKHKKLTRAKLKTQLDVAKELDLIYKELSDYALHANKVVVVASNHDDFIKRYLEDGDYINDPINYEVAHRLVTAALDGNDPLEFALRKRGKLNNVRFLGIDEDFRLTPKKVQLGAHGHLGPNGARGSAANLEKSYANAIIGHSHTSKILRRITQVGTSTLLKLGYNKGPSSWVHSLCYLYPNGTKQLIHVIQGKYRA